MGSKKNEKVVKLPTASDRTIPMWSDEGPGIEEEERDSAKSRGLFDPDNIPEDWSRSADGPTWCIRLVKFQNGQRGLQLARHEGETKNPSRTSVLVMTEVEFVGVARQIFRESKVIQGISIAKKSSDFNKLAELVDMLEAFCRG